MFEEPMGKTEKDRSRIIMLTSGSAVLLVIALIILVSSFGGRETAMVMSRPGSDEFDSYAQFVTINITDKRWGERLGGRYGRIIGSVQNAGDRAIAGVELRAVAVGLNDEVYKEKITSPVPTRQELLLPDQSIEIDIYLEPIPDPAQLRDMIVEVYGLKLK